MQATKILDIVHKNENSCEVSLLRWMDNQTVYMTMPMEARQFKIALFTWRRGALVQNAFPDLDSSEREFLMTGITPAEWDEMFPDE